MRIHRLKMTSGAVNTEEKLSTLQKAAESFFIKFGRDETLKQMFLEHYTYNEIANWAEQEGLLTIDKETFKRYLTTHRTLNRSFFDSHSEDESFCALAGTDVPIDDHRNFILMKMRGAMRVMEKRLNLATKNELHVNMLLDNTNKDFRVYLDLLTAYDKAVKTGSVAQQTSEVVGELLGDSDLSNMEDRIGKEKQAQDRMSSLVQDLVKVAEKK